MLLLTIGYGAACLAGQNEDGTLALVAALPVRRRAILLRSSPRWLCRHSCSPPR